MDAVMKRMIWLVFRCMAVLQNHQHFEVAELCIERLHRAKFNPTGSFTIYSVHITRSMFERAFHFPRQQRTLKIGAVPSILKAKVLSIAGLEKKQEESK